nr:RNA 2',3'-cyclic phosphodiesterase [Candidatus Korarchaeota archaeon]NIU85332.1 RNA 2',3'-cyclic phosphodiesterase [Candidatus Thorarchaeota archaeon]NIW13965.1 RNA 2',3'-cyclic phosphodiesterase [Candidatus Thorarchaeota archaeon]NIW52104.1 RNA 2',3'-cyclic phosphodiesterase [Candidatus Korarchaeota archaeon]
MRSFISVDIEDEEVLSTLHDLTREVSNTDAKVNPVPRENLHITLKFLGDIEDTRVPEIKKIIKQYATDVEPFPLTLVGMGAFPSTKRP